MLNSTVFLEDLEWIASRDYIEWGKYKNKNILVTGATGLIGRTLVNALLYVSNKYELRINVIVIVRNKEHAMDLFGNKVEYIIGSVEYIYSFDKKIDYIIHAASPTASNFFVNNPVETIKTALLGTLNLLDYAKDSHILGFVYLSSMEVYGEVKDEISLTEDRLGFVNPLVTRNCYPESKRMCEALCNAYAKEYGIRTVSLRLAQTFGPGVAYSDERVFAMMARCALNGKDIKLNTKGTSRHPYIYTAQAVSAILCLLLRGDSGEAYNVANPKTYCSIFEMAGIVTKKIAENKISVITPMIEDKSRYPVPSFLNLNIDKIKKLGWSPEGNLEDMYFRMITDMREENIYERNKYSNNSIRK